MSTYLYHSALSWVVVTLIDRKSTRLNSSHASNLSLHDALPIYLMLSTERPISQARLDVDVPLSLCPEFGSGHFNAPGTEGHRNGEDWAPVFTTKSIEHDENSATFTLQDDIAGLELLIELQLDFNSDVVQKRITVTNTTAGE